MHADQRVLGRHGAVVAAAVLCLLFAGRVDGLEQYPTAAAASEMVAPLIANPDAQQHVQVQQAEVMPVAPLFTEPVAQQPELVPVPQLITKPGAAAETDGAYSQPNEPASSTAEGGEGYFTATTTPESPSTEAGQATDQTYTTQPSPSSESKAAPVDATQPSTSSSYGATGQTDADGEPTNGLSPKAIANIVKEHNVFRAREHVPPLKWNASVAAYAQRYAEERKGDCKLEHSTGGPYGENLMYGQGKAWTWKQTVDDWSAEKKSYHYRFNSCDAGEQCGHYTAVVWKHTTDVGCGRVTCASGDTLMVCSYWPPGNYDGEKPY